MLKKTIHTLEQKFTSSSSRTCDVHMKWNNLFRNWVRNISSNTQNDTTTSYSVPREKVDCIVIGAGVVGIAVARALALKGREVIVIESAPSFGTGTSSRNSEVVHAGIYYPRHSFK
ncbi:L-2-hydroxyglutarate dehydrogenase mitochondrial-like, partial [Trifolium pratense]